MICWIVFPVFITIIELLYNIRKIVVKESGRAVS
jgi:hypothetical protein